jgi:hypothetical protein
MHYLCKFQNFPKIRVLQNARVLVLYLFFVVVPAWDPKDQCVEHVTMMTTQSTGLIYG